MNKKLMIAISGKSGCGNTTVSKMVADTLGLQFINFTFRSLAVEKNIEFRKVVELAASDEYWDREVDRRQVKLALDSGGCVLGSRLAIWMLKDADLKVYLRVSPSIRAKRIVMREGDSPESAASFTAMRDAQDHERYLKIYGIDNDDYQFADLVIDADELNPQEITDIIVNNIKEKTDGKKD